MGKFSKVWDHAKRVDENSARCNLCEKVLSAKGGNTSTLKHHLIGTHHIDIDNKSSTSTIPRITSFLSGKPNLSKSRGLEIDRRIAAFIAQDGRPISTVEGVGFQSLINFLEPEYKIKSRDTTTVLIKRRYDEGVKNILVELQKAHFVAFTTDMWTSMQNIAYMCVTAHWIDHEWELKSAILQTRETSERHTGQNISVRLTDCATEWDIPVSKIAATVHDNGSNINAAMNLLDSWPDQRCFAHTLQLAISAGLKVTAIARMLGAARRIAAHFKRSTVAAQALREKQKALGLQSEDSATVSEILMDCTTRWNSTLDMVERLIKLRWSIGSVLSDPQVPSRSVASSFNMTDENWALAEALVPILKPFKDVTVLSSGQRYLSISSIYAHLYVILKNIPESQPADNAAVKACRKAITDELRSRYYPIGFIELNAAKAAVVDPRYKLLKFFQEAPRQETYAAVRLELTTIASPPAPPSNKITDAETEPKTVKMEENIFDDLASLCAVDDNVPTVDELTAYLSETPLTANGNILQYWRDNSKRYPKLAVLARKYLCIPATSVPSESAFSTAGHIVNRKRASLSPETVDMLVFLNRNWKFCEEQ